MNIKVKRKRIFIVITCTISTLLIALISALPMYLLRSPTPDLAVHICPVLELMPVRDIQIALRDMGYLDTDEIDGIWCNQRMIDAWKAWERNLLDESVIYWMKEMEIK